MVDDSTFNFMIPKPPKGERITEDEAEQLLLEKLEKCEGVFQNVLWDLAYFYSRTGRQPVALKYLDRFIATTDDPEKHAGAFLGLGHLMEQMENFEAAISFYSKAFSLEPENTPTWYLINNNLGYCLNILGRSGEAESYCRSAVKIDPERYNAYKNLGISFANQGHYAEAARNYIQATRVNAGNMRALLLLEQLFAEQPEIVEEIPDIEAQIQRCQEAVRAVAEVRNKMNGSL
jgi:tetratricopeptide (TPR) repeat protein